MTYELSGGGSVTKIGSQGRREERESVYRHKSGVEHECGHPDLPVEESISDESSLVLVTTSVIVEQQSSL